MPKIRNWYGKVIGWKSDDWDANRKRELREIEKEFELNFSNPYATTDYLIEELKKSYMKKTPEQRIAELEKKIDETLIEIVGLKNELSKDPEEKTVVEIVNDWLICWQNVKSVNCSRANGRSEKLEAIRDMIAVADYLNEGWVPNWNNGDEVKWYIDYGYEDSAGGGIDSCIQNASNCSYFKTEQLAKRAIQTLGEERIKLALS